MTRVVVAAMAWLACVAPASYVLAEGTDSEAPRAPQTRLDVAYPETVHGEVRAVDAQHRLVKLTSGEELMLNPDARVFKDGEAVSLNRVEEGDEVRASFGSGGRSEVRELDATASTRQILDGIPQDKYQQFLHDTWTSG